MPSHEGHHESGRDPTVDDDGRAAQWVAQAAKGDQNAWRELVDAYARRVFGLLRSQGCDPARAEEITQRVFEPRANMSFTQSAERPGQPLGTVLARHHRALRKLRSTLEGASKSSA